MRVGLFIIIMIIVFVLIYLVPTTPTNNTIIYAFRPHTINLTKYMGNWYEIARLPVYYQKDCIRSMATYSLNADNTINITNQCVTPSGTISVNGKGKSLGTIYAKYGDDLLIPGIFNVQFDNQSNNQLDTNVANYNILLVNDDYTYALVGTLDRQGLWILSRTLTIDQETYDKFINYANNLGYDTKNLIFDNWNE